MLHDGEINNLEIWRPIYLHFSFKDHRSATDDDEGGTEGTCLEWKRWQLLILVLYMILVITFFKGLSNFVFNIKNTLY